MDVHNTTSAQSASGQTANSHEHEMRGNSSIKPTDQEGEHIFKHAPPRPAGDLWQILLKPELEADTERCNAWKEEVQNLLIFAGLFSAVVTAFVIESYKFIQPDPNAAIVGLLYHIASTSNNSLPFPPSVNPVSINAPFSSTPSSMRINVFWFLSLILSLTTVLIGTISLQWLREHQSYPNFTPQEKVAILHMRLEAFDAWYVPQIFAGLPVLLQASLALFLAGMIDFALPLGVQLAIPVAVVIGVTLLFLGCTTTLPALQCLSFFFRDLVYPRTTVPTPCAFKSPQSQAFRVLAGLVVTGILHLFPKLALHKDFWGDYVNPLPSALRHLAPSIYRLWDKQNWRSWPTFDREWVSFRDACHHHICDRDAKLFEHQWDCEEEFPLSDVTQALVKITKETPSAKHTTEFLEAAVHCFEELSTSVWGEQRIYGYPRQDRRSNYFEQLLQESSCSLAEWLVHGGVYQLDQLDRNQLCVYLEDKKRIFFHRDQMLYFIQLLLKGHSSSDLAQYCTELWRYIIVKLNIQPLQSMTTITSIHNVLEVDIFRLIICIDSNDAKYSTVANMLMVLLKTAASHCISQDQSLHAPFTQPNMREILDSLASLSADYLSWKHRTNTPNTHENQQFDEINNQYASIFEFVAEHLNNERANATSNHEDTPSVLFYLAAIFTWGLLWHSADKEVLSERKSSFEQGRGSLLGALLRYRTWVLKSGRKNDLLDERFGDGGYKFSRGWWDKLFDWGCEAGLEAANEEVTSRKGGTLEFQRIDPIPTDADTEQPHDTTTHSESQPISPPLHVIPIPIKDEETEVQQTDTSLLSFIDPATAPDAHPNSVDTPSDPLPRLSVQPDEIHAAGGEELEELRSENQDLSILVGPGQPPASVSGVIDNERAPETDEPHAAIDVDADFAGAPATSAAVDHGPEGNLHTAIDIRALGYTEAERVESTGGSQTSAE